MAEQSALIEGAVALARMHRLGDTLLSQAGDARVSLRFACDAGGLNTVGGRVRALLEMECQRCLRPVPKMIDRRFRLALTRGDAEALRLQADYEVLEVANETVLTEDLVEDELLLSVPLIPVHEDPAACDAVMLRKLAAFDDIKGRHARTDRDSQYSAASPFAVLKGLKGS